MDFDTTHIPELVSEKPSFFKKVKAGNNIWYYNDKVKYAGDYIYVSNSDKTGYGGGILEFPLECGHTDFVVGPWHSNSRDLYEQTGIDLRCKHATFMVVGKERHYPVGYWANCIIKDVIYKDNQWKESKFNRAKIYAQKLANHLNKGIAYFCRSGGGSMSATEIPTRS